MKKFFVIAFFSCFISTFAFSQMVDDSDVLQSRAQVALINAEVEIEKMRALGMSTDYVSDLLVEAKSAFEGENPDLLLTKANYLNSTGQKYQAQELFDKVYQAQASGSKINANYSLVLLKTQEISDWNLLSQATYANLEALDSVLNSLNSSPFNLTSAWQARDKARESFQEERLKESQQWINRSYLEIEDAKSRYSYAQAQIQAAARNFEEFLKGNWLAIVVAVVLLSCLLWFANSKLQKRLLENKIRDLEKEQYTLRGLLKKAQEDYFLNKKISKQAFESKSEQYRNRLTEINSSLPVFKDRLKKASK